MNKKLSYFFDEKQFGFLFLGVFFNHFQHDFRAFKNLSQPWFAACSEN